MPAYVNHLQLKFFCCFSRGSCVQWHQLILDALSLPHFDRYIRLQFHKFHTWCKFFNLDREVLHLVDAQPIVELHHLGAQQIRVVLGQHRRGNILGVSQEPGESIRQTGFPNTSIHPKSRSFESLNLVHNFGICCQNLSCGHWNHKVCTGLRAIVANCLQIMSRHSWNLK